MQVFDMSTYEVTFAPSTSVRVQVTCELQALLCTKSDNWLSIRRDLIQTLQDRIKYITHIVFCSDNTAMVIHSSLNISFINNVTVQVSLDSVTLSKGDEQVFKNIVRNCFESFELVFR